MTTAVNILKLTHTEATIKVTGTAGDTATITLDSLLPFGTITPGAGNISSNSTSPNITGTNTGFASNWIGAKIYKIDGTYIGTVLSVTNPTSLVLSSNAAVTYTGPTLVQHRSDVLVGPRICTIMGVNWTGAPDAVITISRGGAVIMTLQANAAGMIYFDGQTMVPDSINATSDIVVSIAGGQAELWMKLRKSAGYNTTVEYEQYGVYDDESRTGSSTTLSGSPDKV